MALLRCQVSLYTADQPVRDNIVNTFFLRTLPDFGLADDNLPTDIVNLWDSTPPLSGFNRITCRIYDMGDSMPRPIKATKTKTVSRTSETAPREVSLCLSYGAGANTGRRRGRMYLGPFPASIMAQRPALTTRQTLITLGQGISNLGGPNVSHVIYSPTADEDYQVDRIWVDDEWDTQRSRGLRATTRSMASVSG